MFMLSPYALTPRVRNKVHRHIRWPMPAAVSCGHCMFSSFVTRMRWSTKIIVESDIPVLWILAGVDGKSSPIVQYYFTLLSASRILS